MHDIFCVKYQGWQIKVFYPGKTVLPVGNISSKGNKPQ